VTAVQLDIEDAPAKKPSHGRKSLTVAAPATSVPTAAMPAIDPGLAIVERFLNDPTVSAERVNQAFDFYLRMRDDAARKAFDEAVSEAKAEIKPIVRNAKGHNDKRYADFSAIAKAVDPVLGKHGLSYRFRSEQTDRITVTCRLAHKAGHAEETSLTGPPDTSGNKNAIQAIGSTLSYLQRYSLVLMLGLAASNDDDGTAAAGVDDGPISEDLVQELIIIADEVGADKAKFCKFYKIDSLADIRVSQFQAAKKALLAKGAQPK
jgi:hypothetical protein